MRKWIAIFEDAERERESLIADIAFIVGNYVTAGEGAAMHKFNEVFEKWPRPEHEMTLYRVLRLTDEQMAHFREHHAFQLHPKAFSSWTKDEEAAKLLASTKGENTIVLTHTFPPAEIVIDVADFYEEHDMTGGEEYWKYVKPEQEVIVKHVQPFEITQENSRAYEHAMVPHPQIGDEVFYFDQEDSMEIEDVDYEQPYASRGIYTVTYADGQNSAVRFVGNYNGANQWEVIEHLLHEEFE